MPYKKGEPILWEHLTWDEAEAICKKMGMAIICVGAIEQHGPHLPLDTDTRIATAVSDVLAARLQACEDFSWMVAPAVAYGASGEHEGFSGTISIGTPALAELLVEFARSACRWAARLVFLNGHGGNVAALRDAAALTVQAEAFYRLALAQRRQRLHADEARHWQALLNLGRRPAGFFEREAFRALAVHYEHRLKDPERALAFARQANAAECAVGRRREAKRRLERLERQVTAIGVGSSPRTTAQR